MFHRISVRSGNLLHDEHGEYCFETEDQESNNNLDELNRWPTRKEISEEMVMLGRITGPMVLMGLLLFSKGMVSALFLG